MNNRSADNPPSSPGRLSAGLAGDRVRGLGVRKEIGSARPLLPQYHWEREIGHGEYGVVGRTWLEAH